MAMNDMDSDGMFQARNLNTPGSVLAALAHHLMNIVRYGVAANSSTPVEVLVALAGDSHQEVFEASYTNPSAPLPVRARALASVHGALRFGDSFTDEDLHAIINMPDASTEATAAAMSVLVVERGDKAAVIEAYGSSTDPRIRDAPALVMADLLQ